jgi:hypothetical protein
MEINRNVPLQNFTVNSDIDWSKSVADIDRQLYAKYVFKRGRNRFYRKDD